MLFFASEKTADPKHLLSGCTGEQSEQNQEPTETTPLQEPLDDDGEQQRCTTTIFALQLDFIVENPGPTHSSDRFSYLGELCPAITQVQAQHCKPSTARF
jgi:hypothetical protein